MLRVTFTHLIVPQLLLLLLLLLVGLP